MILASPGMGRRSHFDFYNGKWLLQSLSYQDPAAV
jgi:hypothetical protein